jgi:hypothetical protein
MTGSSAAGIVSAAAGVITALALVIGGLPALIKVLAEQRRNNRAIGEVHKIVNQQRTDMQNYQRALINALREHGIDIPIDQSISEPEGP